MYLALYGVSFSVVSLFCVARRASWILTKSTARRGREIDSGLGTLLKCDRKNRRRRRCETGFAKRWHNDARPGEGEFNVSRISTSPTLYDLTIRFLLFCKMHDESVLYFAQDSDRSLDNFLLRVSGKKRLLIRSILYDDVAANYLPTCLELPPWIRKFYSWYLLVSNFQLWKQ